MRVFILLMSLVAAVPCAEAQNAPTAPTTPPLRGVAKVWVQESGTADPIAGQLARIDQTTLTLLVDGQPREIPFDRVLRIDARGDSVKDGAIIGACVMVALVAFTGGFEEGPHAVPLVFWSATYGALAGAGIDAMHVGRTAIYKRPDPAKMAGGVDEARGVRLAFKLRF
jgi:hypothetical protein